jgi:hypothetical protein
VLQVQDLELAVPYRLDKALGVLVDDHRPKVDLAARKLEELLVQALGRQSDERWPAE